MTMFVFCEKKSQSALDLCKRLDAVRLRYFDGLDFWTKKGKAVLEEGDTIIPWGRALPALDGIKVLNGIESGSGVYEDPPDLYAAGLRTIMRFTTKARADEYVRYSMSIVQPTFGRRHKRYSGSDLLLSPNDPFDYWTFRYQFDREFRFHVFDGKIIRTAERVVKDGYTICEEGAWQPNTSLAHPWVRTGLGGWKFKYEEFTSNPAARNAAIAFLRHLGLAFGVVDIGIWESTCYITGFSTSPKLDEKGLDVYVRTIEKWVEQKDPVGANNDSSGAGRGGEAPQPAEPAQDGVAAVRAAMERDRLQRRAARGLRGALIRPKPAGAYIPPPRYQDIVGRWAADVEAPPAPHNVDVEPGDGER